MAKTAAQRQADYRAQRAHSESPERRLNTWITTEAFKALEALAERYGVTMRGVIEILLALELEKPRALSSVRRPVTAKKPAPLPRNKVVKATPAAASKPAAKKSRASRLPRNEIVAVVEQPAKEQPAPAEKSPRPSGAQFEFEL